MAVKTPTPTNTMPDTESEGAETKVGIVVESLPVEKGNQTIYVSNMRGKQSCPLQYILLI